MASRRRGPYHSGAMAPRTSAAERSNAEWLAALAPDAPGRSAAIEELRLTLVAGLRRGLLQGRGMRRREFAEQAEDFAQEAMVRVLAGLDAFRDESRFVTWAHKIALRVALTELRRKRWNDVSLDTLLVSSEGESIPRALADPSVGPEGAARRAASLDRVLRYIREDLTDKQRTAMTAAVLRGMPLEEVARRMSMSRNALYKLLHDARKRLKRRMLQDGITPDDVLAAF